MSPLPASLNAVPTRPYRNWHWNVQVNDRDVQTVTPDGDQAVVQLKELLRHCLEATPPERLCIVGSGWSLSELLVPANVVLQPRAFRKVQPLEDAWHLPTAPKGFDLKSRYFLVDGGAPIEKVNHVLASTGTGYALPTHGAANGQAFAGAIATGTHGAAADVGAVHDAVRAVCLVLGPDTAVLVQPKQRSFDARLNDFLGQRLSMTVKDVCDDEAFGAAVVSVGACGLVHSVVVEAVPLYQLVGAWRDAPIADKTLRDAIASGMWGGVVAPPAGHGIAPDAVPFNVAMTFSPYATGDTHGLFASFLWKIAPTEPYPSAGPPPVWPSISGDAQWWLAHHLDLILASPLRPVVPKEIAKRFRDNAPLPKNPVFPGHVFGRTSIPSGQGRSTELVVARADAAHAIDVLVAAITDAGKKSDAWFPGFLGLRFVGQTRSATLGTNDRASAFLEMPSIAMPDNQHANDQITKVCDACWTALEKAGIRFSYHWGQENRLTPESIEAYFTRDKVDQWKRGRAKLMAAAPPAAGQVFSNPLTRRLGLT